MSDLTPSTPIALKVTNATLDEDAIKLVLLAETDEGDLGSMAVYLQGYDEKNRKYVESKEALSAAADRLNLLLKDSVITTESDVDIDTEVTIDNVEEVVGQLSSLFEEDLDATIEFTGYLDLNNGRFSLRPIVERPQKVTEDVLAYVSEDPDNAQVSIVAIHDDTTYNRFNFMVELPTGTGDALEKFRISQFLYHEDVVTNKGKVVSKERKLGTKYTNKSIDAMRERFKNAREDHNDALADKISQQIQKLAVPERRKLVGNMKDILDLDVDTLLEEFEEIPVKISVESIGDNGDNYFLVAELA